MLGAERQTRRVNDRGDISGLRGSQVPGHWKEKQLHGVLHSHWLREVARVVRHLVTGHSRVWTQAQARVG